jgi:hypothetical protein
VLSEHAVAARELDQKPLRGTSATLRQLAAHLREARRLVVAVERASGVTDLVSWGDGLPERAELERQEAAVRALSAKAAAAGAPTKAAVSYTIDRLLEIHEQHEGEKPRSFVIAACELIGLTVTEPKFRAVERWRARRERFATAHERAAHVRRVLGK